MRESAVIQKVRVMRDDDAVVPPGLSENIFITAASETNIASVLDIKALAAKNLRDLFSHAFVYKEAHSAPVLGVHSTHFIFSWQV
jgi:hypothetical protein